MKLLLVSTSYPEHAQDWQGIFIKNLLFSLVKRPGVSLSLWSPPGIIPEPVAYVPRPEETTWLKQMMVSGGIAQILRTKRIRGIGTGLKLLTLLRRAYSRSRDADVVHVNWLQNALPMWGIRKPAVISVLGSDFGLLSLPGMTGLLRSVISQRKCILAPNGEWMVPGLRERFGDIAEVRCIPLGVDPSWFDITREPCSQASRTWLVVSRLTAKKIGPLFQWGRDIFKDGEELHVFGPMQEEMTVPGWVHYHGSATPRQLREEWFPKAEGLITLSQHDEGRPQVILEAMASGLPVLASDISAHNSVIQHLKTGFLAKTLDDVKQGIAWLSDPGNNRLAGRAAREWIRSEIGTWDDCAARYAAAYETVLRS